MKNMRRAIWLVALLVLLPGLAVGQEFLRYYPRSISDMAREIFERPILLQMDVCPSNPCGSFVGSAVNSGTSSITGFPGTANHPGIVQITSAAGADSGYNWWAHLSPLLLAGGETYVASMQVVSLTNLTLRLGFGDAASSTNPVDGVYLEIVATGVATGIARNNDTSSVTNSTYTVSIGTWYRVVIRVLSPTLATFYVYSDAGVLLWSDSVSTNIPTGAGRNTGVQVIATRSDGGTAALVALDYMTAYFERSLVR